MENLIGYKIPEHIVKILISSGFDCEIALKELSLDCIKDIEQFVQCNRDLVSGTQYESVGNFRFLPGHRSLILGLPKYVEKLAENSIQNRNQHQQLNLTVILHNLLETVRSNENKHPKSFRYSEIIRHFSTYIFLMCGRACYETLSANLPIPTAGTICKCTLNSVFDH